MAERNNNRSPQKKTITTNMRLPVIRNDLICHASQISDMYSPSIARCEKAIGVISKQSFSHEFLSIGAHNNTFNNSNLK